MQKNAIHYERSDLPAGTPLERKGDHSCPSVSAGHEVHEYTTGHAQEAIFNQFGYIN